MKKKVGDAAANDQEAFVDWLSSVASNDLKPPVKGLGYNFIDSTLEEGYVKFHFSTRIRRYRLGMVVLTLAVLLFDFILLPYDIPFYVVGTNIPAFIMTAIAYTSVPEMTCTMVKKRELINTILYLVIVLAMATFGASTSDLSAPIVCVMVLVCGQLIIPISYHQQIIVYTVSIFYLFFCLLGMGLMGGSTNYDQIYSDGYCMNNMECSDENFKPEELSMVCSPMGVDGIFSKPTTSTNITYDATDGDVSNLWNLDKAKVVIEHVGSYEGCRFVHNKVMWVPKQIFYLFWFWVGMCIAITTGNKSERSRFYQLYIANKEKFQVRHALKQALEQQMFNTEDFQLITSILKPEDSGTSDPLFDLHIDQTKLEIGQVLGRGAQGVVLKGTFQGFPVAVKTLINVGKTELVQFRNEIALTKSLTHPNIVKLIGITVTRELLGCILEFISNGTLEDVLDRQARREIFMSWEDEKLGIIEGSVAALKYLHQADYWDEEIKKWQKCVVHRDLKPANILITGTMQPKISDFGCSRFTREDIAMTQIGTPIYAAPEVILGEKYNEKVDVYSFAIVMVGLCHDIGCLDDIVLAEVARVSELQKKEGKSDSKSASNVMKMISKGLRPPLPEGTKPCLRQMIEQCWQGDPKLRPSSSELNDLVTHFIRPQLKDQNTDAVKITEKLASVANTQEKMRRMSVSMQKLQTRDVPGGMAPGASPMVVRKEEGETQLSVVKDDESLGSRVTLMNTTNELQKEGGESSTNATATASAITLVETGSTAK